MLFIIPDGFLFMRIVNNDCLSCRSHFYWTIKIQLSFGEAPKRMVRILGVKLTNFGEVQARAAFCTKIRILEIGSGLLVKQFKLTILYSYN
jgi:hypothetical protein